MDMTAGIAMASMQMAESRVVAQTQVAMMKNVMDLQEASMAMLLQTMGVGQNLNVQG